MAEKKNQLLKITLVLFAVITLGYGVIFLFFPGTQVELPGGEAIDPSWIRWFGGVFIALGIGSVMVFRNPLKQGIFVTSVAIGTLIMGLTLFYSFLFENEGYNMAHVLIPAIGTVVISVLFWISLRQSKEILW